MTHDLCQQIVAGAGYEAAVIPATPRASNPYDTQPSIRQGQKYWWPYTGAGVNRHNWDFLPPHRSGAAAVRMSWDRITRRVRWLLTNNVFIRRLTDLLVQYTVGDGISIYSAAIDHLPIDAFTDKILDHRLFLFGDESDAAFEWWADRYADVTRKKTLYEMQTESARDLFGAGNTLWLRCAKRTPERIPTPNVCWQVLEAEQLDRTKDRQGGAGITRISNGIEYGPDNEPTAYHLWDAHPYDDGFGGPLPPMGRSERVPASRVIHLALTSRPSQDFGAPLANVAMQPANDTDWLVGHELTSAAIAAGLTIAIKEAAESGELNLDGGAGDQAGMWDANAYGADYLPHVREVGLASGSVARLGQDEDIKVIQSGNRPNLNVVQFAEHLFNQMSLAYGVSFHRALGNPQGASFASLRAMMGDDRAMSRPLTRTLGRRLGQAIRAQHDQQLVALGGYQSVEVAEYLAQQRVYQDYEIQGPPPQHLTQLEDVKSAAARIRSGLSTLREECALLNKNFRKVLRQLALEKSLTEALGIVLDFSAGGGGNQLDRSSNSAGDAATDSGSSSRADSGSDTGSRAAIGFR